jgi:cyclopropane-fatty-acyl-phospholipid synthase
MVVDFPHAAGDSLKQAQLNKLDALIAKADVQKGDHVLEIGCGWGSMAIRAVQASDVNCFEHRACLAAAPAVSHVQISPAEECPVLDWSRKESMLERSFMEW